MFRHGRTPFPNRPDKGFSAYDIFLNCCYLPFLLSANFAYDVHYFETTGTIGSMNFSGTDKTITTDMTDIPFDSTIGTTTSYKTEQSETSDDNMNDELEDTLEAEVNMMRPNLLRQASVSNCVKKKLKPTDIPLTL